MGTAYINRPETLYSLFPGEALGRLTNAITAAVDRSFRDPEGRMKKEIPLSEIRSRFAACIHWAKILRGDSKWGLERIIGQFDEIIRCHLAKIDYQPSTRQFWLPADGA